ncbi:unnamed protein product [Cyprideis torosa]|uniref:Uncharacterized protein n=1 Tax=Cyprideis torosa TaxID=163714 RepID=A0A7R8WWJ1_9CRUS|nr:unnamed protein product [Cyprideis torosa]CAG0907977.1 unnamed protein product [Cyprideis torosa]
MATEGRGAPTRVATGGESSGSSSVELLLPPSPRRLRGIPQREIEIFIVPRISRADVLNIRSVRLPWLL